MIKFIYPILNLIRRSCQRLLNFSTVGVKALVINAQNEVLLVQHTYIGGWHFPGGGLARHETPQAAMVRELREETGIQAKGKLHIFHIYSHQIFGADDYPILFVIKDFEILPHHKPSMEIKEVRWFPIHHLPPEITPETQLRLREYFENQPPSEYW